MVIDGHSLVYRAYFVLAPRTPLNLKSTGEPTGAVFGFANMLLRAWADVRPDYWAITFDMKGPTFRDALYSEYKAGRAQAPDELSSQFVRVKEFVAALGMPVLEKEGFEADDLIGTLGVKAAERGIETVVLTGDTDTLQLVNEHVRIRLITGSADTIMYDANQVRERYTLEPRQIIDFKAIKGDSSDHILGVPGLGDVSATKLLQEFGSVEGVLEHLDEITPARIKRLPKDAQEKLRANADRLKLNKVLVTIDTKVPLEEWSFEHGSLKNYRREAALEFLRSFEFNSMVARLPTVNPDGTLSFPDIGRAITPQRQGSTIGHQLAMSTEVSNGVAPAAAPPAPRVDKEQGSSPVGLSFETVATFEALDAMVAVLRAAGSTGLHVAGSDELAMRAELIGLAFGIEGRGWYLPLGHLIGTNLDASALERLRPLLEDERVKKLAHNGKYDAIVLAKNGITLRGLEVEITIAAQLLGATRPTLEKQAFEGFGQELMKGEALLGKGAKKLGLAQTLVEQATPFAASRAEVTMRLWPRQRAKLHDQSMYELFADVELKMLGALARMERHGVLVRPGVLNEMSTIMARQIGEIEHKAYEAVGHEFGISSPKQISDLLFLELNLPKPKKTTLGYSTDATVLEGLRANHPVIEHILEYRQITKLKSTYVDSLPNDINPVTGRVHTTYSQTDADTGRLSSSAPNLQNIPVRTEVGKRIREAFVAPDDWLLLSGDYSQIELRVLAHYTRDPGLVEAFAQDEDIHRVTASRVYNVPLKEVTSDQRRFAKVVNFGLLYGMSEFGLATRADITRAEAAPIIEEYFKKFPAIQQYLDDTKRKAREQGYVETLLGRRRYTPDIRAANYAIRSFAERKAINAPIQGSAADVIKLGMLRLQERMDQMKVRSHMILQVHDELIFEVPPNEIDTMRALVLEIMPAAMKLAVPLKVDLKQGRTWGEME